MKTSPYKHFSFDLWMTLIRSNPDFKQKRAEFFQQHYNPLQKDLASVQQAFRQVDLMCNTINEKTGKNIDAEEMYLMVIYLLTDNVEWINQLDISRLYSEMETLVFEYPPVLYSELTRECLHKIKAVNGNTLSILSNTAFIKGVTLRAVLQHLQIADCFNFQLYSDEVGISKPGRKIFELMLEETILLRKNDPVTLDEIIHIGDNSIADIAAANDFGIRSFQINSNDQLITDLFN